MAAENGKNKRRKTKHLHQQHVFLIVEDDLSERDGILQVLRAEGHIVLAVADETIALGIARDNPLSMVILDASRCPSSSINFCRQLRFHQETRRIPILMIVTDQDEIPSLRREKVQIDDFLMKPFPQEELHACVQALVRGYSRRGERPKPPRVLLRPLREASIENEQNLVVGDLHIDLAKRSVIRRDQRIEIGSALLFELLVYLVRHCGTVLTRDQLLTHVWGYTDVCRNDPIFHTISVHVHWLRELLEDDPERPQLIQTVRGVGYRFKE